MGDTVRPSGIVTFLFTDIEGSTRRWEADPDTMRAELAAHDEVLRSAIESHEGWLFKHTGDGVCAAFTSPKAAVDAAIDAQRSLTLPVRMGIATGEAELRGEDYFGPALNRAARVMAAGHGGQVLLVASTASLITAIELVDLGPRQLRDLSEPVRIFQVVAEGLGVEFPALKTLDTTPGNLRAQATSFIGRDDDIAELAATMAAHRVVTLTGVGGVGKTRLALQVAAQLAPEFPEGVWVIELAPVTDPGAVPDAVASTLGIIQQAGMTVAESVANALDGRLRLLVFDNCEHVLDAAADLIEAIVARSSTVKILATSREGLGTGDERLWPVRSLAVAAGAGSDAVTLFVERAQALVRGFIIDGSDDLAAVVEICRRLDGIPLAIELAAARMVSMTPTDVRDNLNDRFRLLSGSRRGLERHQTLRHAVQWSYDLLSDDEQELLNRCSVFAGGFDLAAAVAVAGDGPLDRYTVLDLLDALVRKSLVTTDRSSGHARFGLLETIRQFAEDQLATTGASDHVREVHAHYYAQHTGQMLDVWNSPRQRDAYDWWEVELDNLRGAHRYATDHDDLDTASTIAINSTFIGFFTQQHEPIAWVEELLEAARTTDHHSLAALTVMACTCCNIGRVDDGLRHSDAAVTLIDDPRYDPPPYDHTGFWIGVPHIYAGHPDVSLKVFQADMVPTGDPLVLARSSLVMGLVLSGRSDEAMAMAAEVVTAAEAANNPASLAMALFGSGSASRFADPHAAMHVLRRGLALARDSGNRFWERICTNRLAGLETQHGDPRTALDLFTETINGYHDVGDTSAGRGPMAGVAMFLDRVGRHEPAAVIAGYATTPFTNTAYPELVTTAEHLRDVFGDDRYTALTRQGQTMTPAEAVRYTLAEIEHARDALTAT